MERECGEGATSGGADLHRGPKAHQPCAEGEDGGQAGSEGREGASVQVLEDAVAVKSLDSPPLVAAREGGTQLAPRFGIARFLVPALCQDPVAPKDVGAFFPASDGCLCFDVRHALSHQAHVGFMRRVGEGGRRREDDLDCPGHVPTVIVVPEEVRGPGGDDWLTAQDCRESGGAWPIVGLADEADRIGEDVDQLVELGYLRTSSVFAAEFSEKVGWDVERLISDPSEVGT